MYYNIYLNLCNNSLVTLITKHKNKSTGEINSFNHLLVGQFKMEDSILISDLEIERRFRIWQKKWSERKRRIENR
jgi:hypothetical protein